MFHPLNIVPVAACQYTFSEIRRHAHTSGKEIRMAILYLLKRLFASFKTEWILYGLIKFIQKNFYFTFGGLKKYYASK